jgi:hypothetical protein
MGFLDDFTKVITLPVTIPLNLAEKAINTGTNAAVTLGTAPAKIIGANVGTLAGAAGAGLGTVGAGLGQGIGNVGEGVGAGLAGAIKPLGFGNKPSGDNGGGSSNTLMYVGIASASIFVLGTMVIIVKKKK